MLYVCPTPIGNLEDVTLRVLAVLRKADLIACEDTRHTGILLKRYEISTRLVSFHDFNEEQRLGTLLPLLREGRDVALVSDAGMPGLSDPGFSLVRACAQEGLPVTVLPGPSAVPTALVLSGLPSDRFAFVGFLARGKSKLLEQLEQFEGTGATLVAFDSPRRIETSLGIIAARWPQRTVAVCRELTKIHEEVVRGTAGEVLLALRRPVRGEIVVVLGASGPVDAIVAGASRPTAASNPPFAGELEGRAKVALAELERLGVGTKRAAAVVAGLTGLPARRAYDLALAARPQAEKD